MCHEGELYTAMKGHGNLFVLMGGINKRMKLELFGAVLAIVMVDSTMYTIKISIYNGM